MQDHTGGNVCGTIIYRETSLPLLLSDAAISLFGGRGLRTVPFQSVFQGRMKQSPDELIVQLHVPGWALGAPHFHVKRTTNEKIDYPLVSMAALVKDGKLRAAFSGVCPYPFRSAEMEAVFNDRTLSYADRADQATKLLPGPVYSDAEGSGEYRVFVFKNMVQALLQEVENGQV
ncbi:MAG: FAD binding domain-containing protein [Oscillospiraceae bacterium]